MSDIDTPASLQHVEVPTDSFPWPPRAGESALDALAITWKESVFHPTRFFRSMPREGDYGAMLGYYLIIAVVAAGVQLFWHMVLPPLPIGPLAEILKQARSNSLSDVMSFLFSPVLALIVLYILAGVAHVMLLLVGGAKHGFETTTRAVAFSHSPAVFVILPYVGGLLAGIWSMVVAIIGLREAHETSTGRAATAVLLPFFLMLGLVVLATLAALAIGLTSHTLGR